MRPEAEAIRSTEERGGSETGIARRKREERKIEEYGKGAGERKEPSESEGKRKTKSEASEKKQGRIKRGKERKRGREKVIERGKKRQRRNGGRE